MNKQLIIKNIPPREFSRTVNAVFFVLAAVLLVSLCGCSNGTTGPGLINPVTPNNPPGPNPSVPPGTSIITMTTKADQVTIWMAGSGNAAIDWGVGELVSVSLTSTPQQYKYSGSKPDAAIRIEAEKGITQLSCSGNDIENLDISKNTALTVLDCSGNNIENLDISKNTALTVLDCSGNNIENLDISKNTTLEYLNCGNTSLYILDISKNTALTEVICNNTNLDRLDVSNNTELTTLWCDNNKISVEALNVLFETLYKSTGIKNIYCSNNPGSQGATTSIAERQGWTVG